MRTEYYNKVNTIEYNIKHILLDDIEKNIFHNDNIVPVTTTMQQQKTNYNNDNRFRGYYRTSSSSPRTVVSVTAAEVEADDNIKLLQNRVNELHRQKTALKERVYKEIIHHSKTSAVHNLAI